MSSTLDDDLLCYISAEDIEKVEKTVFTKIKDAWCIKAKEVDQLKIDVEKCKSHYDHQKFQLEEELVSLRDQLDVEGRGKAEAEIKLKKQKDDLDQLKADNEQFKIRNSILTQELEKKISDHNDASDQSATLVGSIEAKNKIIDVLKEQIQSLEDKYTIGVATKCEAVVKAEEVSSLQMQLEFKEKRLQKEHELMTRQMELLEQQLRQRTEESLQHRNDNSDKLLSLQTELNRLAKEVQSLEETNNHLNDQVENKSKRVEELLKALKNEREISSRSEETFRQELTAQRNMSETYKKMIDDHGRSIKDLEQANEEYLKLLQEASEEYGCLEANKKKMEEDFIEKIESSEARNSDLKEQLDKVNTLLEASTKKDPKDMGEISSAAASVSQLMSKGLSLSQLYGEYLTKSEKLLEAEEDVKRLTRYVEDVAMEIDEKGSVFKKQKEDYERALETINALHAQMDDSLAELGKQRINHDEAQRRVDFLGRENARLVGQVKDLNHQITVLLLQAEDPRRSSNVHSSSMFSPPGGGSAGDFISSRLVSFRNVSELQEQNIKLLASIRELTKKLDEVESLAVEKQTKDLQDELDQSRNDLDEIRVSKERQQALLEDMTRQRDMYKALVQQSPKPPNAPSHTATIHTPSTPKETDSKLQEQHDNLVKELALLRKNHDEYVKEKSINDKLLQGELSRLKESSNKTVNENIKLLSQADYNEERMKTAQASNETLQRQLSSIQENKATLQSIIGRHEGTIETLRGELMNLTKKLSHAEVTACNLREERTLLKESNARLAAERENITRNQNSTEMLMSNLEMIKNNLDRCDSQTKMRYENQIADLTKKLIQAQSKLDSNIDYRKMEYQIKTLEERELAVKEQYNACKCQLETSKAEYNALKKEMEELQNQSKISLTTSPVGRGGRARGLVRLGSGAGAASPTGVVRDLQVQLNEEKAKVVSLTKCNDESKKHCEQLKNLSDQYEKQLKSATEASKIMQQKLEQTEKKSYELEEQLENLKESLLEAKKSNLVSQDELKTVLQKVQSELASAKVEVEEMRYKLDEATATSVKAKREAQDSASLASSAQDKYEREVMLHGADLQALAILKEKLASHNSEFETVNSAKLKAEEALRDTRLGFEERENILRQERKELTARVHELEEQNQSILDQFTQLSDKMASIQAKHIDASGEKMNRSFSEEDVGSSDQLREVIKYLRKERELAVKKLDVAQSVTSRVQAQKASLESKINTLTATLEAEREKAQVSLDTAGKYGELLRKVQTMDALADSNRVLREDSEKLKITISEKHAQLTSIENQIGPLQKQLRENNNRLENMNIEKKSLENEKEMYKRRTQELVEKLNKAKPEDMLKLQQEVNTQKKSIHIKEQELSRSKNQVSLLQKNQHNLLNTKSVLQNQVSNLQKQLAASMEETKKINEDSRKSTSEKLRMNQQLNEAKQKEANLRKELETNKKENEAKDLKISELETQTDVQNKSIIQLKKIAKKYKTAAGIDVPSNASEDGSSSSVTQDRINELEETITSLKQQMEPLNAQLSELQESAANHARTVLSKDEEIKILKSKLQGVPLNVRSETENKKEEELQFATSRMTLLNQVLEKTNKKLEESETKSQLFEKRMIQLEKDKEQLTKDLELQRKSQTHLRQFESLQKQPSGISKPSTSAVSSEKVSAEVPPTANIKPMAPPVATVSSPRTPAATQIVAPSRTIPTASIRPLAPTASGQVPGAVSSVVVVSPLDSLSEGMVSSTVTLPQATVTPTPATPTPTQPTPCTTTLTATVSPTPATLSSPAVTAFPHQSTSIQGTPPTSLPLSGATSSQSTSGSAAGTLLPAQPSTSAQVASVSPSTQMCSSFVSVQPLTVVATVAPQQDQKQEQSHESLNSADALISQAIAMVIPRVDQSQSSSDDLSESSQPSGSHKRKLDTYELEEEESKRKRMQTAYQEEVVGPSSSQQDRASKGSDAVELVYVESDEESESGEDDNMEAETAHHQDQSSEFHHGKQDQGSEAEAEVNAGNDVDQGQQDDETPSESNQSVSQSQQPQPSSGSSQASSTQSGVPAGLLRPNIRSPLRRPQDASSEGGVSTSGSPGTSGQRSAGEGASIIASILPRSGQDDGKFTEADSVASEVGEDDEQTEDDVDERSREATATQDDEDEDEEGEDDEDDEDVEAEELEDDDVNEDEDDEDSHGMNRSTRNQPSLVATSSSSSGSRRRTPITWGVGESAQSMSGRNIMGRTRGVAATRGVPMRGQKAKRSKPNL